MPKGNRSSVVQKNAGRKPPAVQSISRAGQILLALGAGFNTITEIAQQCGLSKSTVHRLLKALDESRVVSSNPINHRYYLGPLITQLSSRPQSTHEYLINSALNEMKRLADITKESVTVGVLSGIQYIHLREETSKFDLRVSDIGRISPRLFIGASTKALYSLLDDEKLRIALKNLFINQETERTPRDNERLMAQIEEVRQKGYSISYGEAVPGAACIAAPIRCYALPAVLNILGPESRIRPMEPGFIREIKKSSERITQKIDGVFGPKPGND